MGAAAQIGKLTFGIERDILTLRNAGNDLGFVMLALVFKKLHSRITRHHRTRHWLIFFSQLCHTLFKGS